MKCLVIGFRPKDDNGVEMMEPLYLGDEMADAREIQDSPPEGIARTELHTLTVPVRRGYVEAAEAEAEAVFCAPVAEDELETEPGPVDELEAEDPAPDPDPVGRKRKG